MRALPPHARLQLFQRAVTRFLFVFLVACGARTELGVIETDASFAPDGAHDAALDVMTQRTMK